MPGAALRAALLPAAIACAAAAGNATALPGPGSQEEPPALVVLLVVDQLRPDLLERYGDRFEGGLRRLLDRGRLHPNATHDHAVTETAPGHASLVTGVHPARHGVVSNLWWERVGGRWQRVPNIVDPTTPLLDDRSIAGASPERLRREGVADWLVAQRAGAKVVSVSAKDRAAVLMASKAPAGVYWYDELLGRFVTSRHYADAYPDWVTGFNDRFRAELEADSAWTSTIPAADTLLSGPDARGYEGDGVHTAFPHLFTEERGAGEVPRGLFEWHATTPVLDRGVLELGLAAVDAEGLGREGPPDLLALSLSQTDRIGHAYGPTSREQQDNLLELDRALEAFFEGLDRTVGEGRWRVLLTSDHGVLEIPEYRIEQGLEGHRFETEHQAALEAVFQEIVRRSARKGPEALATDLARAVKSLEWVADAWTHTELREGEPSDSFRVLARNSLDPERPAGVLSRFGVELRLRPYMIATGVPRGTTHGSPYLYDRRVPVIVMGAGVPPGVDDARVATVDVAPTLAAWLGLEVPPDLDGRPLGAP